MSADSRTPHTDALDTLGSIITPAEKRDAIHLAVENVVAGETLAAGDHIGFYQDGRVGRGVVKKVGIVDPFLEGYVSAGDRFWLVVYPRQITSLRHVWTHPDFPESNEVKLVLDTKPIVDEVSLIRKSLARVSTKEALRMQEESKKLASEKWMRAWAVEHMSYDYYGDQDSIDEQYAYDNAIRAGHDHHIGPYEDARDHIDNVWWDHWEVLTGEKGSRGEYFSCGC